jgi:hypothetical protein
LSPESALAAAKWQDRQPFWRYRRHDSAAALASPDPIANVLRTIHVRHAGGAP